MPEWSSCGAIFATLGEDDDMFPAMMEVQRKADGQRWLAEFQQEEKAILSPFKVDPQHVVPDVVEFKRMQDTIVRLQRDLVSWRSIPWTPLWTTTSLWWRIHKKSSVPNHAFGHSNRSEDPGNHGETRTRFQFVASHVRQMSSRHGLRESMLEKFRIQGVSQFAG